eukprot:4940992-Heterocapsa_arctica.AAC.1
MGVPSKNAARAEAARRERDRDRSRPRRPVPIPTPLPTTPPNLVVEGAAEALWRGHGVKVEADDTAMPDTAAPITPSYVPTEPAGEQMD